MAFFVRDTRCGYRCSTPSSGSRALGPSLRSAGTQCLAGRLHRSVCLPYGAQQRRTLASSSEAVLERARHQAIDLGFDPSQVYEPWLLSDACQQGLVALQGLTGDSASAVLAAALLLRIATWPLNVRALQRQCDRVDLLPVYMGLAKELADARRRQSSASTPASPTRAATRAVATPEVAKAVEKAQEDIERVTLQLTDFQKNTQFNPLQGMGYQFFCLMPMYVLFYCSVRGMMAHPDAFRNFVVEPSLWLDSLVLADPLGILPVVSACAVLLNAEINSPPPRDGQEENAVYFRFVIRGAVLAFVPLTSMLASSMLVFMATNATYTALVTWIYRRYYWTRPHVEPRWLVPSTGTSLASTGM